MATRSRIGILNEEKMTVDSIYCHWDGYPKGGVGEVLFEHWRTEERVRRLIRFGEISSLTGETVESYDDVPETPPSHSLIRWPDSGQEYEYLFTPSLGTWSYRDVRRDIRGPWSLLSEALKTGENPD